MSGEAPTSGGYMTQRHGYDYASSGDDLEDDACSIPQSQSPIFLTAKTRVEVLENVLWIFSAVFIVYFGDCHSNFIHLLFHDNRIRRMQMFLGLSGVSLNVIYFLYTSMLAWGAGKSSEKRETTTYALPLITILGLISFCLYDKPSIALFPVSKFRLYVVTICLQILFCFVADLEFLDSSSCVHIVHGFSGHTALCRTWDIYAATIRYFSYRLKSLVRVSHIFRISGSEFKVCSLLIVLSIILITT